MAITKNFSILLFQFFLLLSINGEVFANDNEQDKTFYLGGIQVNEADHSKWISSLKTSKFNTVAVTSYAHQGDWDSDNLWFSKPEENVIDEIRKAKKAGLHVILILRVAIDHAFPRNTSIWHGMIMPNSQKKMKSWFNKYNRFVMQWAKIAQEESVDVLGIGSEMNSLTSTIAVEKIPNLEEYHLDDEKIALRKKEVSIEVKAAEAIKEKPDSLKYVIPKFEKDAAIHKDWARRMTFLTKDKLYEEELSQEAAIPKDEPIKGTTPKNKPSKKTILKNADIKLRISKINTRRENLKKEWLSLIRKVRTVYKGKLTYAANFDQYHEVGFWNELDIIGVNAYFSLRDYFVSDEKLFTSLVKGWSENLEKIYKLKNSLINKNKPLIFTELGFRFKKNSTIQPWAMDGFDMVKKDELNLEKKLIFWNEEPIYFKERVLALSALKKSCSMIESKNGLSESFLNGLLYWKLSSIPSHLEIEPFVHILGSKQDMEFESTLQSFYR